MKVPFSTRFRLRSLAFGLSLTLATILPYGCSDSPTDSGSNGEQITADYYIQANVDGKVITNQLVQNNTSYGIGEAFQSSGRDAVKRAGYIEIQKSAFVKILFPSLLGDTTYKTLTIGFVKVFPSQPFDSDLDAMVTRGSMNFGSELKEEDGVVIQWTDLNGTLWSSDLGTAEQNGSAFTVASHTLNQPTQTTNSQYTTKGTFSCKLYDGKGNSIDVKDGVFSLHTVLY